MVGVKDEQQKHPGNSIQTLSTEHDFQHNYFKYQGRPLLQQFGRRPAPLSRAYAS